MEFSSEYLLQLYEDKLLIDDNFLKKVPNLNKEDIFYLLCFMSRHNKLADESPGEKYILENEFKIMIKEDLGNYFSIKIATFPDAVDLSKICDYSEIIDIEEMEEILKVIETAAIDIRKVLPKAGNKTKSANMK